MSEGPIQYIKIKLEISDTGCGIKKENLSKLFMDFGKLDEHSKVNAQGTGLGLSICKKMIEKMGGSVAVDSIEGHGTTFTVKLILKSKVPPQDNDSSLYSVSNVSQSASFADKSNKSSSNGRERERPNTLIAEQIDSSAFPVKKERE